MSVPPCPSPAGDELASGVLAQQLEAGSVDAVCHRGRAAEVARRFGEAQVICAPFFVAVTKSMSRRSS